MNLLNKVFVTLSSLTILFTAVALIWISWSAPRDMETALRSFALFAANNPGTLRLVVTGVGGITILLCLLILLAELSPESKDDVQIAGLKGGNARIGVKAVRDRSIEELGQMDFVVKVDPIVNSSGSAADITIAVQTTSDSYLTEANNVLQIVRDAVENDMGVKIRRLNTTLTTEPLKTGYPTSVSRHASLARHDESIIVPEALSGEPTLAQDRSEQTP
ncbi:MAG: hypothetical protein EXR50_07480 [Dehalococcoidia bacterium]|nr:hypothetical protein [Dehalococcoidia bacterium]